MPVLRVFDPNEDHADFEVEIYDAATGEAVSIGRRHAREPALYAALDTLKWHVNELETLIKLGRHNVES
jgi:hypothetical protein